MNTDKTATANVSTKPEPTSEALVAIRANIEKAWDEFYKLPQRSPEAIAKNLEIFKLQGDEKSELANIAKAEREAQIAEQRNARVKMFTDAIEADRANVLIQADKKADQAAKDAAADLAKTTAENVTNELLAKYTVAKMSASSDKPAGTKGGTSAAIKAILVAELAGGKTLSEAKKIAEAAGYSRGTTGAVATQMVKDGEATN